MTSTFKMCAVAVFASGFTVPVALAADVMPAAQQNALVQKYCAVCHNDAHVNGGLTLERFDAASPDPSVVAMLVSKIRDGGAISAAGVPKPDAATQDALLDALLAETAGASDWTVTQTPDAATHASLLTASILREVPVPPNTPKRFAGDIGAPDVYRLTLTCRSDTREGDMVVAWAPGAAPKGSILTAVVDGKPASISTVEGSEKMFKGTLGTMGTGATILNAKWENSGMSKLSIPLPEQTLAVNNLFQDGTVEFSFASLPRAARKILSNCFAERTASR
jgi:hypothetical protein